MARRTSLSTLRDISEINMTPLMDLTFILLITFIITFPLIEQGIPMDLPGADAQELNEERARTISVDVEGQVYLDDVRTTMEDLAREMSFLGRSDPKAVVLIRADQALQYGKVVDILKILQDARISRMALVTKPESGR